MSDRNDEIIELLGELVELTILDEGSSQSFRVRAYENAMHELELVRDDISQMSVKQLVAIDGVGKSTAQKIREYYDSGAIAKLETLREKYPPSYRELTKIPGLGPKGLQKLRAELGVEDLDGLRAAVAGEKIRELAGFGEKSEEKIARAIERMSRHGKHRRTAIADAMPVAEVLVARIAAVPGVEQAVYCGSLRRFRDTVADIDIVAATADAAPAMSALVEWDQVGEVLGHGDTKSSIVTPAGLQVDLRVVSPEQMGAAVLYFTGSKAHNIGLRQRAIDRGWTLNEYGLTDAETGAVIASKTEEDIYRALDMTWIPAPMREDTGEIALAAEDALPAVLQADAIVPVAAATREVTAETLDRAGDGLPVLAGLRPPDDGDLDDVLRACVTHRVAVDIDGDLAHLTPPAEVLRRAGELGVAFVVRDAPADYTARLAQRGWVVADAVLNTWSDERLSGWLADR